MAIQDHMKNLPSLVEVDAEAVSEVEDMHGCLHDAKDDLQKSCAN